MIVATRKPLTEIRALLGGASRVLVAGCGTCVAVCLAGGDKEAAILTSQLMLSARDQPDFRAAAATVERQCDREFLHLLRDRVEQVDAVVSLACGAGIQFLAEVYPKVPVIPGVNTAFIGVAEEAGRWSERCRSCNQCLLGSTAGVCPVTMCAKGLLNGPCAGTVNGKCEVDPDQDCAWTVIWRRLELQGRLELMEALVPPLRNDRFRHPAQVIHPAYRRRFSLG